MTTREKIEKARQNCLRRLVEANGRNDERAKAVARETFCQLKSHYERLDALDEFERDVPEIEGYESWSDFKQDWYL